MFCIAKSNDALLGRQQLVDERRHRVSDNTDDEHQRAGGD
jgi:hypothetical protein